jgi:hypothetical protein
VEVKYHGKNMKIYNFLLLIVFFTLMADQANASVRWDREIVRSTLKTFGINRTLFSFSHLDNLAGDSLLPSDRVDYNLLKPVNEWQPILPCGASSRGSGSIQTDADQFETITSIRVAIPFRFKFSKNLEPTPELNIKDQILFTPIIKVQLLTTENVSMKIPKTIHTQRLKPLGKEMVFRVRDLNPKISPDGSTLNVDFNEALVTETFAIPGKVDFRVRVEWTAQGFCGELDTTELALGDQLRILRSN